jgi:hypothetical protein
MTLDGDLRARLQERLQRPDWPKIAFACKWGAGGRCQTCGKQYLYPFLGLHAHHVIYVRLGNERPSDLTALCGGCHAIFTWVKQNSLRIEADALHIVHAIQSVYDKFGIVRLKDVEEVYARKLRDLQSRLGDIEGEADMLLAMAEVGRDGAGRHGRGAA